MNSLEFNDTYNKLLFTEYEQDDFSYIEIPGTDDFDLIGEENE